ncbi:hypothetical protein PanWU01x14_225070, partial [Parasponia andersonii]
MDSQRYQETVERCSLVRDFEMLPYGDLTEIGERGEYVMEALSDKIVLLVTHQVDFLPAFDSVMHKLLSISKEFKDLVNAHKETAGSERLAHINHAVKNGTSSMEIKKSYTKEHFQASRGDQLIKQEERETGNTGLKPYKQYLNQNKGNLYFSLALTFHLIFAIGQILQNSWMAANVDNPRVSTLQLIVVYLL